ncbi:hypothetical protein ElyMa_001079400 [Elysia marginata]|uniref:Uncharacterized protein n=1 Tax=Elysia marginata TaxID=1093978 RepID=A0AAV4HRM2_9GAST|nr:hypothetical protein ElyMa_001079400 [Elysia marginata]
MLGFRSERSGVRVLLSAGRRLVLEKGYLQTFLRLTHELNEYPTIGSERSCQNARVMRLSSCSSTSPHHILTCPSCRHSHTTSSHIPPADIATPHAFNIPPADIATSHALMPQSRRSL